MKHNIYILLHACSATVQSLYSLAVWSHFFRLANTEKMNITPESKKNCLLMILFFGIFGHLAHGSLVNGGGGICKSS